MKIADFATRAEKSLTPFWQSNVLNAAFYGLIILSIVFFAFYSWKTDVSAYMRQSNGLFVFFPVFAAAVIIYAYLNLCGGNGEFVIAAACVDSHNETLPPVVCAEEEQQVFGYTLPIFFLHAVFLLLPALPIFVLATAISGLPFSRCWAGIGVIFATAFCAKWIGFLLLLLFGRGSVFAYVLSRIIMALLLFATWSAGSAYNSLHALYELHVSASDLEWAWNNFYWRYLALTLASAMLLIVLCHIQQRRRLRRAAAAQPITRRQRLPRR